MKPSLSAISFVLASCALLFACASGPAAPRAIIPRLEDVPPQKIVVVGRVELHPPLQPGEQMIGKDFVEDIQGAFLLLSGNSIVKTAPTPTSNESEPAETAVTDEEADAVQDDEAPAEDVALFTAMFEKEFFLTVDRDQPFFLHGGTFYTAYDPPTAVEPHTFEYSLRVDLKQSDEAVYIGTIQYFRDERNNLTRVAVRDDFQWAEKKFRERYGDGRALRKSLAVPAQ
jgi:hypothetical protein